MTAGTFRLPGPLAISVDHVDLVATEVAPQLS
jgi:hypothetical protein